MMRIENVGTKALDTLNDEFYESIHHGFLEGEKVIFKPRENETFDAVISKVIPVKDVDSKKTLSPPNEKENDGEASSSSKKPSTVRLFTL